MYRYSDIERLAIASGCVFTHATGSHHNFRNELSGLAVTIPKHAQGLATGTAKSIIESCVLIARLNNVNIGSDRYKLSNEVYEYIYLHHAKCKENPAFLIPDMTRKIQKIETEEEVMEFLAQLELKCKKNAQLAANKGMGR